MSALTPLARLRCIHSTLTHGRPLASNRDASVACDACGRAALDWQLLPPTANGFGLLCAQCAETLKILLRPLRRSLLPSLVEFLEGKLAVAAEPPPPAMRCFLCLRSNLRCKALVSQSACAIGQVLCYDCAAPLQLAAFGPPPRVTPAPAPEPNDVGRHLRAEALPRCTSYALTRATRCNFDVSVRH